MVAVSPSVNYPCENMPYACSLVVPSQVAFPFPVKHALFPSAVFITELVISVDAARVKSVERRPTSHGINVATSSLITPVIYVIMRARKKHSCIEACDNAVKSTSKFPTT